MTNNLLPLKHAIGALRLPVAYLTDTAVPMVFYYTPGDNPMYKTQPSPECTLGDNYEQDSLVFREFDRNVGDFKPLQINDKNCIMSGLGARSHIATRFYKAQANYTLCLAISHQVNLHTIGQLPAHIPQA